MHGYRLTNRGKIIVAVVFALIFFMLPAAILLLYTMTSQPTAKAESGASGTSPPVHIVAPPSVASESPPPNGGGFSPTDGNENTGWKPSPGVSNPVPSPGISVPEPSPGALNPTPPQSFGPVGGNPSDGTLSFSFSPDLQDRLDEETVSQISIFLTSSKNIESNRIAIEIPQLSGEYSEKLISAILRAFAAQKVPEQGLAIIAYGTVEETLVVYLSYIPYEQK